ncbi:two-component system CitB family sensor kinase [Nakamurella sp. UYEF19]|uniref:sensor histidine kinase n=1 Tax=Nakamurella sp. UYEF19 TaxID=1756392 RepID=UPI0033911BB5
MRSIASWLLWSIVGVLAFTAVIGGVLEVRQTSSALDQRYEQQARVTAAGVADIPEVATALAAGDPGHVLGTLATRLQHDVGAAYVVITNAEGLRYSHPNPAQIGRYLEEPVQVLDGLTHVGIDNGSLGRSANGKAPVFSASGKVIGQVSVGVLETTVSAELASQAGGITIYLAIALTLGVAVALLLSRAMKRKTFGLELNEISSLLQEREAMLHGIREGVLGFDAKGRVTLLNDEARRLLGMSGQVLGADLTDAIPPGRLRDVLTGRVDGADQVVLTDDSLLVVNRRRVVTAGRSTGSVITLRDRTEMEGLIRELDSATGLAKALRAQEHEFANRLHVIGGLLDLREFAEARSYVNGVVASGQTGTGEDLRSRISPPIIAALLLAKQTIAAERDITLTIAPLSRLELSSGPVAQNVMTVLGNLIDNGLDAVSEQPVPRSVVVTITDEHELTIVVQDNGPGIGKVNAQNIFDDGFTTKAAQSDRRRGIGLALVRRLVARAGGSIRVNTEPGARFEVSLPRAAGHR